jgi:hypothetical protein
MEKNEDQQKDIGKIKEILKKYVSKASLISLENYPSSPSAAELKENSTKGAQFITKHFGGCSTGAYFAWEKKFLLTADELITIEELVEDFDKYLIEDDYHGKGNILQRIAPMKSGPGVAKPSPIALKRHDQDLAIDDFVVFAVPIPDPKIKTKLETLCHKYNEIYSDHQKRFKSYKYSSANGPNGTKEYSIEHSILGFANLPYAEGIKKCAKVSAQLQKTLGIIVAANTVEILASSSIPPSTQMTTITTEADVAI